MAELTLKNFVQSSLIASTIAMGACSRSDQRPETANTVGSSPTAIDRANITKDQSARVKALLEALPKLPTTVGNIEIAVSPEDAQHLVIVVPLLHQMPSPDGEAQERIDRFKMKINSALAEITTALDIKEISGDGVDRLTAAKINQDVRTYHLVKKQGYNGDLSTLDPSTLDPFLLDKIRQIEYFKKAMPLATFMFDNPHLTVVGVEDSSALAAAQQILSAETFNLNDLEQNSNVREDRILKNIVARDKPVHLLGMGAAHDFKGNVEKWNSANPRRKVALAKVDIEGLQREVEEISKNNR